MNVKVFKFGGASVNSAAGVRNVASILDLYPGRSVMIVVSAMGKTTNALEVLLRHYMVHDAVSMVDQFHAIKDYHLEITYALFEDRDHPVYAELDSLFERLREYLKSAPAGSYDEEYDQVVSFGELFSTLIVTHFLSIGRPYCKLFDARQIIRTDATFRDAKVDWSRTQLQVQRILFTWFQEAKPRIAVTQGFIAAEPGGKTTTLGREGSDYTAAILAYAMRTKEVTIWKDVPGVLNADPKWFPETVRLDKLSFREAIELAYFGAGIIHPKTIKPLENADIKLLVKSFLDPAAEGTAISSLREWSITTPVYIRKTDQVLISLSPRDFSFIVEENLGQIFTLLAKHQVRVNVMQNSAITFSICVDNDPMKIPALLPELKKAYEVRYNDGLTLYTIRHYDTAAIERITRDKTILLEQRSRGTVHLVVS